MKQLKLLTAFAAFALLFSSCKNNKSGLAIPKDAAFVFHINTPSLSSKLTWNELKAAAWFKEAYQKTNDAYAQKLMDNPDSSGIDTKNDFAFFIQRRGKGGFGVFEGSVKNAAAFEALCKKISKSATTEKSGDWNMLAAESGTVVAWNSSKFAVINDMPLGNMNPMTSSNDGGSTKFGADSLKLFVKEIMSLDGNKSLFDDDRFASMLKEDGDMHMWVNSSALYSDISGMLSMMKVGSLLSGNVSATTVNFDEGKITMKSKNYMGKEMQDMMEKWNAKKVEASVLNRIPSDNVIGVMAANVDPQSLQAFFKAIGFDGMINMMLAKQNISMNEMFAATQGQFVIAFSDLSMQNQTVSVPETDGSVAYTKNIQKPDFNFLFATSVNKKASFENLLGVFAADSAAMPFPYKLNDNWFVAANKPETIDGFMAGKGASKPFADKISGHPFGMYFDIQRILKTNFTDDSTAKSLLNESAAIWQDVVAFGGEMKDGAVTAEMTVNMMDKKTNSLKQLNSYIEKMYQSSKKAKMVFNDSESAIDSAIAAPPAIVTPE